jgi:anthranilate synthase component 2
METQFQGQKSILMIDNFDSFTFILADYLCQLGASIDVVDRTKVDQESLGKYDGILFSPGPGNPTEMPDLMELVELAVGLKPVFGVCLGFQALGLYYGGTVAQGKPMHGKISNIQVKDESNWLFAGLPKNFKVVRYHSLVIQNIKRPLVCLAISDEDDIMAFAHENKPVAGLQFHPEAHLTEYGKHLLANWLNLC